MSPNPSKSNFDSLDRGMGDCRSLIEFCRAFEQNQNNYLQSQPQLRARKHKIQPFCQHSSFAAIDVAILFLVVGALGFLTFPYFKLALHGASGLLSPALGLVGSVDFRASLPYAVATFLITMSAIAAWEFVSFQSRKCGSPFCRGLRQSVEFDIQLESEECVKCMPPMPVGAYGAPPLELGEDQKELEAELRKMAPMNGRTVLIFRAPCGCPAGRTEVWGPKRVRRIKK